MLRHSLTLFWRGRVATGMPRMMNPIFRTPFFLGSVSTPSLQWHVVPSHQSLTQLRLFSQRREYVGEDQYDDYDDYDEGFDEEYDGYDRREYADQQPREKEVKVKRADRLLRRMEVATKKEDYGKVLENFNELKRSDHRFSPYSYSHPMRMLAKQGSYQACFSLYNDMKKRRVKPSLYTFAHLINSAGNSCRKKRDQLFSIQSQFNQIKNSAKKNPREVKELKKRLKEEKEAYERAQDNTQERLDFIMKEMEKHNMKISNSTVMNSFMKTMISISSDVDPTLQVLDSLSKANKVYVDCITYTEIVQAVVHGQESEFTDVVKVWDHLKEKAVEPDVRFYNALLLACLKFKEYHVALAVFEEMNSVGEQACLSSVVRPDAITISFLCQVMQVLQRYSQVIHLLTFAYDIAAEDPRKLTEDMFKSLFECGLSRRWKAGGSPFVFASAHKRYLRELSPGTPHACLMVDDVVIDSRKKKKTILPFRPNNEEELVDVTSVMFRERALWLMDVCHLERSVHMNRLLMRSYSKDDRNWTRAIECAQAIVDAGVRSFSYHIESTRKHKKVGY